MFEVIFLMNHFRKNLNGCTLEQCPLNAGSQTSRIFIDMSKHHMIDDLFSDTVCKHVIKIIFLAFSVRDTSSTSNESKEGRTIHRMR